MKKKLAGLLVTAVMLCGCLGLSAMAAKPNVEMMYSIGTWYIDAPNQGASPTVYYRNNTDKVIKYIDWYAHSVQSRGRPELRIGAQDTQRRS